MFGTAGLPPRSRVLSSERRVHGLHETRPAEVRIPWRACLVLIHDVAEANASVEVGKSHGAAVSPVSEGPGTRTKRLEAETGLAEVLRQGQLEPECEARRDVENRIDAARLLDDRSVDRAGPEHANAIDLAAAGERADGI